MKGKILIKKILIRIVFLLMPFLMLIGCSNPYALNINKLDFDAEQKYGVIQFSDLKTFPREYLINERREELLAALTQYILYAGRYPVARRRLAGKRPASDEDEANYESFLGMDVGEVEATEEFIRHLFKALNVERDSDGLADVPNPF